MKEFVAGEGMTIVGLGPGAPEQLSLGAWEAIKNAGWLVLWTGSHPVAEWLRGRGISFDDLDHFEPSLGPGAERKKAVAAMLVEESLHSPVVFALPGHPLLGDSIVREILSHAQGKNVPVRVMGGIDFSAGSSRVEYPLDPIAAVMARLRAGDGCPWDREQDHFSLTPYLIEETYEVLDALEEGNMYRFCEELGDLLLQIVFHAQIASEKGQFDLNQVVAAITEKMIRRHPHVFGTASVENSAQVLETWEEIKRAEKGAGQQKKSILDDVPRNFPALLRAAKVQRKAASVGFDWPDYKGALHKIEEERQELLEAFKSGNQAQVQEEMGDLLFAVVNLSRFWEVDAETALSATIEKFGRRFKYVENHVRRAGREMGELSLEELDALWEQVKKVENDQ